MSFIDKSVKKRLIIFTLVVVTIFLLGISIYSLKSFNNGYCGTTSNDQLDSMDNSFADLTIIDDSVYLQEVVLDNQEIVYYEYYNYCFNAVVSSVNPLMVNIVDDHGDVLGSNYVVNSSGYQCFDIGSAGLSVKNNYLGFSCVDCDNSNNLSVVVSSNSDTPTVINGVVSSEPVMDVKVIGVKNCQLITFKLFKYMILFVVLISFIWLIDLFVNQVDKVGFNGWN